jgi:uncharacterized protein (TIGR02246 family)
MRAVSADRGDFIPYTNRVVGTVADAVKAHAAVDALLQAGFGQTDIDVLHGDEDVRRLDSTGLAHGFLAQFRRTVIETFELEEFKHLTHHIEDVRAGRYVIMVLTKRRLQRNTAADVLHRFGAEFVGFYGRWAWEDLPPVPHGNPEDVPALFARAWNDRDPDALAALFDEDAAFVHGTGLCWHDRESIRKAHADRLSGGFEKLTLATGETKVKLLAPEVAVVHTRMTLSGNGADGAAARPPHRSTIASFVVHRAGDRWLCASAHSTDIVPENAGTGATA